MATTRKTTGTRRTTSSRTKSKSGNASNGGSRSTAASRSRSSAAKSSSGGGFIDAVRARPLTTAAIAGAAASAGAFLWAKRATLGEQFTNLTDSLGSSSEEPSGMDPASAAKSRRITAARKPGRKTQSDIAAEALTLKQTGEKNNIPVDDTIENQNKVGAVAY